jgi:DNA-binding NarL/FixJ family response regulator
VIITDLNLGAESGIEFVEWIRKQPAPINGSKIVILSGSASPLQFDAAEQVGADKVHHKPVKLEDLQLLIDTIANEYCDPEKT